jgi:hypothetical protein
MVRELIGGTLEREVGAPLSKLWTVRNLDDGCQTVGLSDYRTLSDCRMYGRQYGIILTQQITVGMAVGHCRTVGLSDCRTVGLSDECRILSEHTVGLSDRGSTGTALRNSRCGEIFPERVPWIVGNVQRCGSIPCTFGARGGRRNDIFTAQL